MIVSCIWNVDLSTIRADPGVSSGEAGAQSAQATGQEAGRRRWLDPVG